MAGLLNTGSFSAHNAEQQRLTSEPSFRTTPGESWCLLNFASPTCTTLCHERKNKKPSTPLDTAPAEPHEVLYDCFHSPTDWLVPHLTRELTVADSSSSGSNANTPVHHFSFSLFLRLVFLNVRWRVICSSSSWCIDYAGVQCDSYGTMTPSRKMTLYLLSRLHYRLNKRMHEVTFRPVLSAVTTLRKLETILLSFATTAPAITPLENARKEGGGVSAITFIYFYLRLGNRTMHWISSCCYWAKKPLCDHSPTGALSSGWVWPLKRCSTCKRSSRKRAIHSRVRFWSFFFVRRPGTLTVALAWRQWGGYRGNKE